MPRPSVKGLTDYELAVMKILWGRSPLSVAEVLAEFPKSPKPAYTSMLTNIKAMEKKGYLRHTEAGKAHLYSPVLKPEAYRRSEVKKLAERFFGGSKVELAVNLIKEEKLDRAEIERLKALLEDL